MKQQLMYDTVKAHLLTQMAKSVHDRAGGTGCAYRSHGGLRCAIGCLLPEDMDTTEFENMSVSGLVTYPQVMDALSKYEIDWEGYKDREFMSVLQGIHDGSEPSEWDGLLADFALTHDLNA